MTESSGYADEVWPPSGRLGPVDGSSRKLPAPGAYARTPAAGMMAALAGRIGRAPRSIVTDHGPQLLKRFDALLEPLEDAGDGDDRARRPRSRPCVRGPVAGGGRT